MLPQVTYPNKSCSSLTSIGVGLVLSSCLLVVASSCSSSVSLGNQSTIAHQNIHWERAGEERGKKQVPSLRMQPGRPVRQASLSGDASTMQARPVMTPALCLFQGSLLFGASSFGGLNTLVMMMSRVHTNTCVYACIIKYYHVIQVPT